MKQNRMALFVHFTVLINFMDHTQALIQFMYAKIVLLCAAGSQNKCMTPGWQITEKTFLPHYLSIVFPNYTV